MILSSQTHGENIRASAADPGSHGGAGGGAGAGGGSARRLGARRRSFYRLPAGPHRCHQGGHRHTRSSVQNWQRIHLYLPICFDKVTFGNRGYIILKARREWPYGFASRVPPESWRSFVFFFTAGLTQPQALLE